MAKLIVLSRVGQDVVAFGCSHCAAAFPVPSDGTGAEKERIIREQFDSHDATAHKKSYREDMNQGAGRRKL
jgi:hypothetical protein